MHHALVDTGAPLLKAIASLSGRRYAGNDPPPPGRIQVVRSFRPSKQACRNGSLGKFGLYGNGFLRGRVAQLGHALLYGEHQDPAAWLVRGSLGWFIDVLNRLARPEIRLDQERILINHTVPYYARMRSREATAVPKRVIREMSECVIGGQPHNRILGSATRAFLKWGYHGARSTR